MPRQDHLERVPGGVELAEVGPRAGQVQRGVGPGWGHPDARRAAARTPSRRGSSGRRRWRRRAELVEERRRATASRARSGPRPSRAMASSLRARRPSIGASRASARWRTASSGPWARSPSSMPDRGASARPRPRAAGPGGTAPRSVSGGTGSPAPRARSSSISRAASPQAESRGLDPPTPEVGDRLGHLSLGRPRLGQPDQDPPRLRVGGRAGQEAPRLPLGLRPRAQAEAVSSGRQLRLGRERRSPGSARTNAAEARERDRLVTAPERGLGGEEGRVVGEQEVRRAARRGSARARAYSPPASADVGLAIALERAR